MNTHCPVTADLDEHDKFLSEQDALDTAVDSKAYRITDYLSNDGWYEEYCLVDLFEETHVLSTEERVVLTQGLVNLRVASPECRKIIDRLISISAENIADTEVKGS